MRRELKFESDLPYEVLTGKVQPWDFNDARNHYLDVAETLRQAMTHNPYLKVFVGQRLLRPGHALSGHALHLRSHRAAARPAQQRDHGLLRSRAT